MLFLLLYVLLRAYHIAANVRCCHFLWSPYTHILSLLHILVGCWLFCFTWFLLLSITAFFPIFIFFALFFGGIYALVTQVEWHCIGHTQQTFVSCIHLQSIFHFQLCNESFFYSPVVLTIISRKVVQVAFFLRLTDLCTFKNSLKRWIEKCMVGLLWEYKFAIVKCKNRYIINLTFWLFSIVCLVVIRICDNLLTNFGTDIEKQLHLDEHI